VAWSRLDDGLDEHRKVDVLLEDDELRGLAAIGLWALTLANSARRLTDGGVSKPTLRKIAPRHGKALAQRLVEAGLYDEHHGEVAIHDYLEFNPSRASVEEKRRKDSERKAAGRSNRNPRGVPPDSTRSPNGQDAAVREESARPVPVPVSTTTNVRSLRIPPPSSSVVDFENVAGATEEEAAA
jgi:hypothetical protein